MSPKSSKVTKKNIRVEGKVWFGNSKFYHRVEIEGKEEDKAKIEFFDNAWKEAKMEYVESVSLLFQKYIPVIEAKIIEEKNNQSREKTWFSLKGESIGGYSKKLFLDKVIEKVKNNSELKEKMQILKNRIEEHKKSLEEQGYETILNNCNLKTSSRLVVGLGSGHVLETSLTLHHIFGIPYIPASALKGVVRMVSFWEIAEKLNKNSDEEIEKLQRQLYDEEISSSDNEELLKHKLLFGTQNFKGLLVFLDAFPIIEQNQQIFELDVMTPHYQGYYTQDQAPGDWENPNPIVFLTVKEGISFCFNVLFDKFRAGRILGDEDFPREAKDIINSYSDLSSEVKKWLETALREFGVGAKTRLGYGCFFE